MCGALRAGPPWLSLEAATTSGGAACCRTGGGGATELDAHSPPEANSGDRKHGSKGAWING
eukprot:4034051-Pyramimonas_sp.AAC.1